MRILLLLGILWIISVSTCLADINEGERALRSGDYSTALQAFRPLAEEGDATAQYNLGTMYVHGHGTKQDYEQGQLWLRRAAEQGHERARGELAKLKTKMTDSSMSAVDSEKQSIESRLKREHIIGRLESQYGVEATKRYVANMDSNAGGDNNIDASEAPDFAKNAIEGRLLRQMHEYDVNFPGGGTVPKPSLFPQKGVKPRKVYETEWKEIVCENNNPYTIVKNEAKALGLSISDESIRIGVKAACGPK